MYQLCSGACGCGSISETRGAPIAFDFSYCVMVSGGSLTNIGFKMFVAGLELL